ncbi:hypothetical protein MRX96_023237 [Rhipicephalus microplus]
MRRPVSHHGKKFVLAKYMCVDTLATTTAEAANFEPWYAAGEPFLHEPDVLHAYPPSQTSTATSQTVFSLLDSNIIQAPDMDDLSHNRGQLATSATSVNHPQAEAMEEVSTKQPAP